MNSDQINKYSKKSIPQLIKIAERKFNAFIRARDEGQGCICCGGKQYDQMQAGHFYSAGGYPCLRFNEDNVHLQAKTCNYFKHGNLNDYRTYLEKKIGKERLQKLDETAAYFKRVGWKWDRYYLIEFILKY